MVCKTCGSDKAGLAWYAEDDGYCSENCMLVHWQLAGKFPVPKPIVDRMVSIYMLGETADELV